MKFLGIDAQIIGDNHIKYYILNNLSKIEKRYRIYIPPNYKDKFYIYISICQHIININYNTQDEPNDRLIIEPSCSRLHNQILEEYLDIPDVFIDSSTNIDSLGEYLSHLKSEISKDELSNNIDIINSYGIVMNNDNIDVHQNILIDNEQHDADSVDASVGVGDSDEYIVDSISNEIGNDPPHSVIEEYILNYNISDYQDTDEVDEGYKLSNEHTHENGLSSVFKCFIQNRNYIKISLFHKNQAYDYKTGSILYDNTKLKFISSYLLDDTERIDNIYRYDSLNDSNNVLINKNFQNYISSKCVSAEHTEIEFIKNNYSIFDTNLIRVILFNKSGYYFNLDDVAFMIQINIDINNALSNRSLLDTLSFSHFSPTRFNRIYKHNLKSSKVDNLFKTFTQMLSCDYCDISIPIKKEFYSCDKAGDLCKKCYLFKVDRFRHRILYFKSLIRLCGKRSVFKKQCKHTMLFLEKIDIKKLSITKQKCLIENSFKNTFKTYTPLICRICFGNIDFKIETCSTQYSKKHILELNTGNCNISVGCVCGHMFHTGCLDGRFIVQCPYCRTNTKFTRLFL